MMVISHTGWASPLATNLAIGSERASADSLILNIHGWHCARRKGWYKGDRVWHRHRRACDESQDYDDEYFDEDFRHSRRPLNLYINPGVRLRFGNQGDN
jgi:hypothetical protein